VYRWAICIDEIEQAYLMNAILNLNQSQAPTSGSSFLADSVDTEAPPSG